MPISVSMPPRIAAKLSGIITAPGERPKRSAIERRIGMKITTIGVLLRKRAARGDVAQAIDQGAVEAAAREPDQEARDALERAGRDHRLADHQERADRDQRRAREAGEDLGRRQQHAPPGSSSGAIWNSSSSAPMMPSEISSTGSARRVGHDRRRRSAPASTTSAGSARPSASLSSAPAAGARGEAGHRASQRRAPRRVKSFAPADRRDGASACLTRVGS